MLRLVYTKDSIKDRLGRDFLELKKNKLILKFRKYIQSKNIYIPVNECFHHILMKKHMQFIIEELKKGSLKVLRKNKSIKILYYDY
jgi:hypothetical protein